MLGTLEKATVPLLMSNPMYWHKHYMKEMHGYRCRPLVHGKAPLKLLHGDLTRLALEEATVNLVITDRGISTEVVYFQWARATRAIETRLQK